MANIVGSGGQWSPFKPVTEKLKEITIGFKADAEHRLGYHLAVYEPTEFQIQIVAGVKYNIHVTVNHNKLTQIRWVIVVELFENLKGAFSFIDAHPLYINGTKYQSHLLQHAGYQSIPPAAHAELLRGGPGPVKPPPTNGPNIPLGPGPVIPAVKDWHPVTKEVTEIAEKEKPAIEAKLGTKLPIFVPVEYATTVQFTTTTYYIIIESGEFKYFVLGEPRTIKFYIEATIVYSILDQKYTVVSVEHLSSIPAIPLQPPIGSGVTPLPGPFGGLHGPYPITPELAEATISFKKQAEEYIGAKYLLFRPVSFYLKVVAGTYYYVKTVVQDANGSQVVYPIDVELYRGLSPLAKLEFVSAQGYVGIPENPPFGDHSHSQTITG